MSATYSITDLAQEFAVTTRAIRFYEDQGLLSPRRIGQRRVYGLRERVRLKLIMRGKRLGLSLGDIREILDMYDAGQGEVGQLRLLMEKLQERRRVLRQQQEDIAAMLKELDAIEEQCSAILGAVGKGRA